MKTDKPLILKGKKILVIVTGSIAAVKTPLLISNLIKQGAEVRCLITPSASKLVSALSLATLSRNRCYRDEDQWNPIEPKPLHIELSEWAEVIAIAPLSASSLSKWVNGLAEGLAASVLIACEKPVIAAAAMNTSMWRNEAVKRNWEQLEKRPNVITLNPSEGLLACDRIGEGKMASPEIIQLAIESTAIQMKKDISIEKDFAGRKFLITAGPTLEELDPARFISNRSSGKMGVILAQAARLRGAEVDLVHGPLQISNIFLEGLNAYEVRSSEEMGNKLNQLQSNADFIAMSAAISDLKSKNPNKEQKLKKQDLLKSMGNSLELVPDLLSELIQTRKNNQIILGFTALTGAEKEIKEMGAQKKSQKGCDLLFANPIDRPNQGFESDTNGGWLFNSEDEVLSVPVDSKLSVSHFLLDELLKVFKKTL